MMKKMRKLEICKLCERPMMFYGIAPDKKGTIELCGPKTHPKVKVWCHGRCLGLIADLDILFWETLEHVNKKDRKKIKAWGEDFVADISRDFGKLVRGLARGQSS